ncbi:50S ribosomal protein L5 [Synoicihabitans lomoniglobus]|uniref:Large ribosomal subunit protein uL5 n=1 Tax=Synoicihabitans lomoniglobus TaxID=2909285 RepID=A0AAF0CPN2_9BACT|nr:50S ribosomal protein L5 [Opitutaceae bacterium LMO-M01]WED65629.1 50S ribosomal protein L5 [Opitutaceae bacterium LMO-M01]
MSTSYSPALKAQYAEQVVPALTESRGYKNVHQVPRVVKVSINSGFGTDLDKNQIADVLRDLTLIAGQKPVTAKARKSVANFKLRQGQIIGAHVTLRGDSMWDFLYRLIAVALPTIRDFRGVPTRLDGNGNYTLGINDFTIFPEITVENVKRNLGFDVTIVTTAETDEEGRELLKLLGMPFRRASETAQAA